MTTPYEEPGEGGGAPIWTSPRSPLRDAARGALAGLAGTLAMQPAMQLGRKLAPEANSPVREDPGRFVVELAKEAARVPAIRPAVERAAVAGAHFGYGMTMGALYGLGRLACGGPLVRGGPLVEGSLLGLTVWGIGYLGWLPAVGLLPPVTGQRLAQVAGPIPSHIVYGIVTAAAYQGMRRLAGRAG